MLRLRQEEDKFEASLDYTVRPCLKKKDQVQLLMSVIPATQKVEIGRIVV
jgi:hypothetical protein